MRYINSASGGIGSYIAGKRMVAAHGVEHCEQLFTDTMSEDRDLYRFLLEGHAATFGLGGTKVERVIAQARRLPEFIDPGFEQALRELKHETRGVFHGLNWVWLGMGLWELFEEVRMIGRSGADVCSRAMKRGVALAWMRRNHRPESCVLYFGIDHSEAHRYHGTDPGTGIRARWLPWQTAAPLVDPPHLSKCDMIQKCERDGIDPPRLYDEGFPHNNCGGFCVKAGHYHFLQLLKRKRPLFLHHEREEQRVIKELGKNVSVLSDRPGGKKVPLTMARFREEVESGVRSPRPMEWGHSCGCFVASEEATADEEQFDLDPDFVESHLEA